MKMKIIDAADVPRAQTKARAWDEFFSSIPAGKAAVLSADECPRMRVATALRRRQKRGAYAGYEVVCRGVTIYVVNRGEAQRP